MFFLPICVFISKLTFSKYSFSNTVRVSSSFGPGLSDVLLTLSISKGPVSPDYLEAGIILYSGL